MNEELIRNELLKGLRQIDENFDITSFFIEFDEKNRKVAGSFTATNKKGEEVSEVMNYA